MNKFLVLSLSASASAQRVFQYSVDGGTGINEPSGNEGCFELACNTDGTVTSLDVSAASCDGKRCPDCFAIQDTGADSIIPYIRIQNCNTICTTCTFCFNQLINDQSLIQSIIIK